MPENVTEETILGDSNARKVGVVKAASQALAFAEEPDMSGDVHLVFIDTKGQLAIDENDVLGGAGGGGLTEEEIEDLIGVMVTSNTESGISVTYDDATGKLNFDAQTSGDGRYLRISNNLSDLNNASTARTNLGLAIGTDVQAYDAELAAIAGLVSAADRLPYFTGSGTASLATFTSAGRALIDDADAAAQLVTLGLTATASELNILDGATLTVTELNYVDGVTSAIQTQLDGKSATGHDHSGTYQPLDSDLTTIAGLTATTDNFIVSVASAWASRTPSQVRTTLGLVIGTNVQAWSSNLDEYSAVNPTSAGLALLDDADADAQLVTLGLTASASELNILDGATLTVTELNYVDGVTSAIQTQLDAKQPLDSDLTTIAGLTATTDNFIVSVASAWASRTPAQVRTTLGLVIGTNVLAYDAQVQQIADLADPNADRILFWDDSASAYTHLATGNSIAITTTTIDTIQDIRTSASPQFAGIELGNASDTTLARSSAGNMSIEGNLVYRAGGTDVPLADGGTGSSTAIAARSVLRIPDSIAQGQAWILAALPNSSQFTLTLTAGRGSASYAFTTVSLSSGNQTNDTVQLFSTSSFAFDNSNASGKLAFGTRIMPSSTTNKSEMWFGFFNHVSTFPTTTQHHVGFRLVETAGAGDGNAILYASNGNGTNGTQTQIATGVGQFESQDVAIIQHQSSIDFYLAGVLVATHTTNLPTYQPWYFGMAVKTTEAVAKTATLYPCVIAQGGY